MIERIAGRSGGAERVLVELANEMRARGHSVDIVSHEMQRPSSFYPLCDGIGFLNLADRARRKKKKSLSRRLAKRIPAWGTMLATVKWRLVKWDFVRRLRRYLYRSRPDVVVPFMPPAMTATVLARRSGSDFGIVFSTHNEPSQDYDNPLRWDPDPIDIAFRKTALRTIDHIVVLTPPYRAWYPIELHDKISVIANPVRTIDRTQIESAAREKKILVVGRLAKVKRTEELLRAWSTIRDEFPDWSVHVFGHGPESKNIKKYVEDLNAADRFHLRGVTENIIDEYLSASLLCHPAAYEGFPLAVSEALASGLPVLGFADCSGLNSLVRHGVNGILVEPGVDRTYSLANALRDAILKPEYLRQLGSNGPSSVAPYRADAVYNQWEYAIRKTARSKRSNESTGDSKHENTQQNFVSQP